MESNVLFRGNLKKEDIQAGLLSRPSVLLVRRSPAFSIWANLGNIFAAEAGSKWPFNTIQQDFCANIQIVIRIMMLIWMMVNKARAGRKRVKCRIQQRVEADCCHLLVFHLPPVLHKPHFLHRTFCRSVHTFTSVCTHCMMPAHKCMYAAVFTRCLLTHSPFSSLARN